MMNSDNNNPQQQERLAGNQPKKRTSSFSTLWFHPKGVLTIGGPILALLLVLVIVWLVPNKETDPEGMNLVTEEEGHIEADIVRLSVTELEEFGVELLVAGSGEMRVERTYPGEIGINEDRYAHITPRVPGVVRSVRASLGDQVQRGQTMATLASRELADMKSAYLASIEREGLALANFKREERLFGKKISSEREFLEAKQALAEVRIDLRSAAQKLRALGFSDSYLQELPDLSETSLALYPLMAPLTGSVVEKHIVQGEFLEADAEAYQVSDLSNVWVNLSIYQKDMGLIEEGQSVDISSGNHSERGTVSYVRPIVGEDTRTALARVVLPNPHARWKPGMFVTGTISIGVSSAPIVVPASALQGIGDETVVFVQTDEGFEPRQVSIGDEAGDQVAVISGLEAGDTYVAAGGFALKSQLQMSEMSEGHGH